MDAVEPEDSAEKVAEVPAEGAKPSAPAVRRKVMSEKLKQRFRGLRSGFIGVALGIFSPDGPTRIMSAIFLVSILGFLGVGYATWVRYHDWTVETAGTPRRDFGGAEQMSEFISKQAEEAKRRNTSLAMGQFTVELKKVAGQVEPRGVMNMAEVEIMLECDYKETCSFVEKHMAQARDQISGVLLPMDRDSLMTRDGKRKLKKELLEKLNLWLPKGKVENLYFSKMVIG